MIGVLNKKQVRHSIYHSLKLDKLIKKMVTKKMVTKNT